jgi:hypothetical protein
MGKAGFQASIEGIVDRLDKFVRSERVANLLCCPESRIDFDEIVREKKILLSNIGRRALGEEMSSVLGKTIYSQLEIAGMSRPRGTKPNLYIYADEFQNYITEGFRITLELGRASNVHLCLTNQHLRDLPDELKGAIFGNVGTVISFNAGHPPDAQTLASVFGKSHGITADQVVRLPRYHTFVKLDDRVFTMTTLPKPEVDYDHRQEIRKYSRKNYCYEPGTDRAPSPITISPQVKNWNWMA